MTDAEVMMKVWFSQIYCEPGVEFPFSHFFQRRFSEEVTELAEASAKFLKIYGRDFELMFRISAKQSLEDNEIKGPSVFRKTKDVEYTVFLPFNTVMRHADAPRQALRFLLKGVYSVFDELEIDKARLLAKEESIIENVCSDPTMLAAPSWDDAQNKTFVRSVFQAFFDQGGRS